MLNPTVLNSPLGSYDRAVSLGDRLRQVSHRSTTSLDTLGVDCADMQEACHNMVILLGKIDRETNWKPSLLADLLVDLETQADHFAWHAKNALSKMRVLIKELDAPTLKPEQSDTGEVHLSFDLNGISTLEVKEVGENLSQLYNYARAIDVMVESLYDSKTDQEVMVNVASLNELITSMLSTYKIGRKLRGKFTDHLYE